MAKHMLAFAFFALLSVSLASARLSLNLPRSTRANALLTSLNTSSLAGQYTGTLVASLKGADADAGDSKSSGRVAFSIFTTNSSSTNVLVTSNVRLTDAGKPTTISLFSGAAGTAGTPLLDITLKTWVNATVVTTGVRNYILSQLPAFIGRFLPAPMFNYVATTIWIRAETKQTDDGTTYADLLNTIAGDPASYYAVVKTDAYPNGAMRGQFAQK